jgi:hypothetical protein
MIRATLVLLACLASTASASNDPRPAEGSAESVLAVYNLRSVMPPIDDEGWVQTMVEGLYHWNRMDVQRLDVDELDATEGPDVIFEVLVQLLGDELHYEGREIELDDSARLVVLAPPELQQRIRSLVIELGALLSGRVELSIDVIDLGGEGALPAAGVVESAEVTRWLDSAAARSGARRSFHVGLAAGRTAVVDVTRLTPFVGDFDVEIAQASFIQDPISFEALEGTRFYLRGLPQEDGVALAAFYSDSRLAGSIESDSVPMRGLIVSNDKGANWVDSSGVQQEARVLMRSAAFDTFLPDGKALCFTSTYEHGNVNSRQAVFVRRTGGTLESFREISLAGSKRKLVVVNTELFDPPHFELIGPYMAEDQEWNRIPRFLAEMGSEPSLMMFDLVASRYSSWTRVGPWGLVTVDPAWEEDTGARLRALLPKTSPQSELVTARFELKARGHASGSPATFALPVRAGHEVGVAVGVLRADLVDYDVEVASSTAVPDSRRRFVFDGMAVELGSGRGPSGDLTTDVRAMADLRRSVSHFDLQSQSASRIDQVTTEHLRASERLRIEAGAGGPRSFVLGEVDGTGGQPALALGITLE